MSSVEARVESESVLHARKSDPIQMARLKIRLLPLGLGIAGVLLCAALICINSRSIFFSLLEFECEHRSAALEAIMLDIAEQRFGDDPKFQSAIGLMSFERSKEESLRAVVMLYRAIDSKDQTDLSVATLFARASMCQRVGRFAEESQYLEAARPLTVLREAKGMHDMEENTAYIDLRLAHIKSRLGNADQK